MKTLNKSLLATCIAMTFALSGCGGGGGGDTSPSPAPSPTPTPTPSPTPTPPPTADLPSEFADYLTDLADNHIIPGYQAMSDEATDMLAATQTFCANVSPTQSDLNALQEEWLAFNHAWQTVQWVKVGPVLQDNRLFRIQFWPDNNDAVSRGVENLLIDPQTITSEVVAGQNVGGQGIPAMEYLLYPEDASNSMLDAADRDKRCEVLGAVAENMVNVSSSISNAWQATGGDYRAELIGGTGDFTSVTDAVEELVTNWLEILEIVKDEKMLIPLDDEAPGRFDITEHFRSDTSLQSIVLNIASFRTLFTAGDGKGFDDILTDALDQQSISDKMLASIDAAQSRIDTIKQDFDSYQTLLNDADGRAQLALLIDDLRDVRDLMTTDFVQALDINIGFNANDGD